MTVAPIAARTAVAEGAGSSVARQGSGKVIQGKVVAPKAPRGVNARRVRSGASAGAGAAAGGAAGGKLLDGGLTGKAAKNVADTVAPTSSARRVLLAEFAACMVILAFSPLTGSMPSAGAFMKRASATMGLFFLLGLLATAGRGASRAAAAFGGLITLVLLISDRSIFVALAKKLGKGVGESADDVGLDAQDLADAGEQVGETVTDIGEQISGTGGQVGQASAATAEQLAELLSIYGKGKVR